MEPEPLAVTEPAVISGDRVLDQENVVLPIVDAGTKFKACPLHTCCDSDAGELIITGTGFTVTATLNTGPAHPFTHGVIS
jgi:hypothetical protein